MSFKDAVALTLMFEGGTNHTLHDRGGLTKWGISEANYPIVNSKDFSKEDAKDIYLSDYWFRTSCNLFCKPVALSLFDSAVNCGQSSAVKWLQESSNLAGSSLVVDGIMGSKSIAAIKSLPPYIALLGMSGYRLNRYYRLVKQHPDQMKFIQGWINRVSKLQLAIIKG